jgi:hypothetical protein
MSIPCLVSEMKIIEIFESDDNTSHDSLCKGELKTYLKDN